MTDRKERPSRLGRGLASLLGEVDGEINAPGPGRVLSVTALAPSPFQPRKKVTDESIDELAASIHAHGVLQPLLVRPVPGEENIYQIIAGERRWLAAQRAGLHEVPVHIRELDDATALAAALIENLQRQDLNAIEEAEGFRRLMHDFGLSQEKVAASVGKSRSHLANTLRLLALPVSVQQEVRRGTLSAGHARALLAHPDPADGAAAVAARGLNVRQTEALSKAVDKHREQLSRSDPLLDVSALERTLTAHLGLRTRITHTGSGGRISLHYTSIAQLDGLIRLLNVDGTS